MLQASGALGAASVLGALSPSTSFAADQATKFQSGEPPVGFRPLNTESNDLTPFSGAWTDDTLRHLLRRSLFGVPQTQFAAAKAFGSMSNILDKLLEESDVSKHPLPQLLLTSTDTQDGINDWSSFPARGATLAQQISFNQQQHARINQITNWWLDTIIHQGLSLRETMTLLWTNHFVVGSQTVEFAPLMYSYLQLCRTFSLGNFKDFTRAIAIEPAMLNYLNGDQNSKGKVNENFARELMELFTLGILDPKTQQPNYTETDIQNAARALSGWAWFDPKSQQHSTPPFSGYFVSGLFDATNKTFLGQTGNWNLDDILRMIFAKNNGYNVAYFVSQKIYQMFVYYVPNATVVDAMAQLMVTSNFEIAPVMRALLSSAHFYDANVIGAQLKSPANYIGSLVREFSLSYPAFSATDPPVTGTDPNNSGANKYGDTNPNLTLLHALAAQQGQQLLNPPNVKGWPGGHNWISTGTFQNREIYSYVILNNAFDNKTVNRVLYNIKFDPDQYSSQIANATSINGDALSQSLEDVSSAFAFGPLEGGDLATLIQTTYPKPNYKYNSADVKNFGLYLSLLPEFQLY